MLIKFKTILIATDFFKDSHYFCVPVHAKAHLLPTAWQGSSLGHQLRFAIWRWSTLSDKEISFPAWRCHPKLQQLRNDWSHCPPVPCPPPFKARASLQPPARTPCLSLLVYLGTCGNCSHPATFLRWPCLFLAALWHTGNCLHTPLSKEVRCRGWLEVVWAGKDLPHLTTGSGDRDGTVWWA